MTTLLPPRVRSVPFARELRSWGDRVALVTPDGPVSYRELADRVDRLAARLGPRRRLVLVEVAAALDPLVGYLAALAGGHPVLLAPTGDPDAVAGLLAAYDPDVVIRAGTVLQRRPGTRHDLHPELALLLSTSGSTGSPKLVRLSAAAVQANAEAIAGYLGIRDTDRAATTLPLHYCYGLSVLHSGLVRGASLLLTDRSVADPAFWALFRAHRCTSLAGVPYTFDLLDRVGFAGMRLPHLRYVTQAGGRLAPDRVRRYAELGRAAGWDLVVMYGQTEATARMAYLPPELAAERPECIGGPVPGGSFRLEPLADRPEPDVGELVYTGPNVMLGYAGSPADLGLGRTVSELRTGDVARRHPDGLYEVVGRRSRFAKVFGLRIDLDRVEAALAGREVTACCLARDGELVVAVAGGDTGSSLAAAAEAAGLPRHAVRLVELARIPRLASGKPDLAAVAALAGAGPATPAPGDLRGLFAEVLGSAEVTEDSTFAGLGGDSLSYVRMSVRLEELLGPLPEDWPTRPVRELRALAARPHRRGRWLETSVALRAVAIVLVVGTHATVVDLPGGAHLLLAVLGFNLARLPLAAGDRRERLRGLGRVLRRIAVPSVLWATLVVLLLGQYTATHAAMLT
ncbi:MAG TPA: non-ribosomal peptide synthetase, partial [Mycobacteriales bacterium]|nr:non-ribosomal peptide synthetase [Mycobacteriales bacterium]